MRTDCGITLPFFMGLRTGYPVLKICPPYGISALGWLRCLGVNTTHREGNGKSQTEKGRGGG